jgi:hypothetical protein
MQGAVTPDAASEGLNLQAAGALINYDLPWNPSKVEQRIGRIDRIGQSLREIRVINFFLEESVDQRIYTVLRQRCGLFEHFVGAMQPVLAAAQTMLLGKEPEDTDALRRLATDQLSDPVVSQMFPDSKPEPVLLMQPPLTRDQIIESLSDLRLDEVTVKASSDGGVWKLTVSGETVSFAASMSALEAHSTLTPLSPFHPTLRRLANVLQHPGEQLPLVIGTASKGAFRAASAWWVGAGQAIRVESMLDLRSRLENWDGDPPDSNTWLTTLRLASDEARRRVEQADADAATRRKMGLNAQRAASRRRLPWNWAGFLCPLRMESEI